MKKSSLPATQSNFLIYTAANGKVKVDVFVKDETVWLTQKALAELFGVKIPAISNLKQINLVKNKIICFLSYLSCAAGLVSIWRIFMRHVSCSRKQLFPFWKQFKRKGSGSLSLTLIKK